MTMTVRCTEIFPGCPGVVSSEDEAELLAQVAAHARDVHGVEEVDDATVAKVREAVTTS
jgi:predicted small metal-binding protein